jgi:hypothetical protein
LVKDICKIDKFSETISNCKEITAIVRERSALIERFRKIQNELKTDEMIQHCRNLEYVVDTRWYTHQRCVSHVIENKLVLEQLMTHPVVGQIKGTSRKKRDVIKNLIKNRKFWKSAEALEKVLKPISESIRTLESSKTNLSDVHNCFLKLLDKFNN